MNTCITLWIMIELKSQGTWVYNNKVLKECYTHVITQKV